MLVEEGAVPSALTRAVVALGAALSLPHRCSRSGLQGYHASRRAAGVLQRSRPPRQTWTGMPC